MFCSRFRPTRRSFQSIARIWMSNISIRNAEISDLPVIHQLIKDSFLALVEHTSESMRDGMIKAAEEIAETELSEKNFHEVYAAPNAFWVAEHDEQGVVGCVGLKRQNNEESELVRMAVSPTCRGGGVGSILIAVLLQYCSDHRVFRVLLTTANPLSAKFYLKNGFTNLNTFSFSPAPGINLTVSKIGYYLGEKIIRHVSIVGGTHGNERIGVELVRQWTVNPEPIRRSTFDTAAIIGNPEATVANRRFIDEDLNRLFTGDAISTATHSEGKRARELNNILGSKVLNYTETTGSDFCIDLHSSNSSVGLVAMISSATDDITAVRLSHHLTSLFPALRVTSSPGKKHASYSVDSITPSGIAFEVGPLVHGTLSSPLLEATRGLVQATLDFFEHRNTQLITEGVKSALALRAERKYVDNFGADEFDSLTSPVVSVELARSVVVPLSFPSLSHFEYVCAVNYPESSTPNGPVVVVVHPSLEGKDWQPLTEGTPIFISADGSLQFTSFDRKIHVPVGVTVGAEEELFPLFINEAAYQSRGIAFSLYKRISCVVY